MNIGVAILAVMLAAGSLLVVLEAGAAHTTPFVDTYGNTTGAATNNTQGIIINGTAPVAAAGGGAVVFLGVIVLFIAAIGIYAVMPKGNARQSRHG
jgi:hypothetical protein